LKEQDVQIALETMAGKGTEIGRSFDEIAKIIDGVTHNEHLSVCLDTCHIHDAGYDVKDDFDKVLTEFDKIIGLDRIKVVHVNDSKNEQSAHKDRHENVGFGYIGFDALHRVVFHDVFNEHLSVCLDTCHIHDAGYDVKDDFDKVLTEFDKIIGLDRIKVVHVNDSKNEQSAHKDRHENVGFGYIGFDALHRVVFHDVFKDLPKILETPFVGEDKKNKKPPYAFEIDMLKKGKFDKDLKNKIM